MNRLSTSQPFSCVTCELEIIGSPTFHLGLPFCCAGCAADGPCICSYDQEVIADPHVRHCLDVADPVPVPRAALARAGIRLKGRRDVASDAPAGRHSVTIEQVR